jgi:hypothetical protein
LPLTKTPRRHFVAPSLKGMVVCQPYPATGEVAEWSNAHAWKACVGKPTGGSNPSLSAMCHRHMVAGEARGRSAANARGDMDKAIGFGATPRAQRVNPDRFNSYLKSKNPRDRSLAKYALRSFRVVGHSMCHRHMVAGEARGRSAANARRR